MVAGGSNTKCNGTVAPTTDASSSYWLESRPLRIYARHELESRRATAPVPVPGRRISHSGDAGSGVTCSLLGMIPHGTADGS